MSSASTISLGLTAACLAAGCASSESLAMSSMAVLGSGVVNDPENRSLRFDMLKFGLDEFCEQMLKGGAPLRLADDQPVSGRFFASSCQSQVLDEEARKSFIVQFQDKGYVWGNPVGRLGFTTAGLVEYAPDFQRHEGALYVYFRPRLVETTSFEPLLVESSLAKSVLSLLDLSPRDLGKRVVDGQLRRGFTVIRWNTAGETEFGMGVIETGERPLRPFQVETEDKFVLENDRTELRAGQQDFVGPLTVPDDDQALYLALTVDGAAAADVLLVPAASGETLVDEYVKMEGPRAVQGAALFDEPVAAGPIVQRFVPVPAGRYYLLLDHSASAGRSAPDPARPAKIDYLVMVGDAP